MELSSSVVLRNIVLVHEFVHVFDNRYQSNLIRVHILLVRQLMKFYHSMMLNVLILVMLMPSDGHFDIVSIHLG